MADRTVRTIFEAVTNKAQKNLTDLGKKAQDAGKNADELTKDLKTLDGLSVTPEVDVQIDAAERELADLKLALVDLKGMTASPEVDVEIAETERKINDVRASLQELKGSKIEARLDVATKDAEKRLATIKADLGELRTMEATPEVKADIATAQRALRDVKAEIRELNGAKAQLTVTADTSNVESELGELGDAGDDVGDDIGLGMVAGIVGALATIPIAGAVIGVGKAIAGGLLQGIQDGLAIEAGRDLFSARTGLDEATAAKFGRAAGEAYANVFGQSVEANLDTARLALQTGLIDEDAMESEIQEVIQTLSGISEVFELDIPTAAQTAGNMIKSGLVKDATEAFDIITKASQTMFGEDLLDTFTEYSGQFAMLGLSGEQAFAAISTAAENGARNTDVVADAFKELRIRITDEASNAEEVLTNLGLNAGEIMSAIASGGPGAAGAIQQILDKLRETEQAGGDTETAIMELFGTPGEDLANAIFGINLGLGTDMPSAAGAAQAALDTWGSNSATAIEGARRNIEMAADGIKGALASAFEDEITGAAEWVQANRAPIMEFFSDVINGAIEAGQGFIEFGATAMDAIAGILDVMADVLMFLPGFGLAEKRAMEGAAESARGAADTMRTEWSGALDDTADKFNTWVGPEIMAARVHDATVVMAQDFDGFMERVNTADGTVTINGDQVPAEEVLGILVDNIDGSDGTVTINGDKVPADQALDTLLALINSSKEDVTIGGDTKTGQERLADLRAQVKAAEDDIKINGDTEKGRQRLAELKQAVKDTEAAIGITANTRNAEAILDALARPRTVTLNVKVSGGTLLSGAHEGGWVKGLAAGGWVPGRDPGYDNVLWPLHAGGQTLTQPLAGGEYVVNSRDASYWAQALEAINSGARPAPATGGTMRIEGVLDTPFGPSQVRGVVRSELDTVGRSLGGI